VVVVVGYETRVQRVRIYEKRTWEFGVHPASFKYSSTFFKEYSVLVPQEVINEVEETASYDDETARASERALDKLNEDAVREAERDADFPLDEGENAAVSLANETDADLFLCDEFKGIGLVHASLSDTRLVTTPKLLNVLVHRDALPEDDAIESFDRMTEARSWDGNIYMQRARELV
jgi:predicted nucleic acid-binding protein